MARWAIGLMVGLCAALVVWGQSPQADLVVPLLTPPADAEQNAQPSAGSNAAAELFESVSPGAGEGLVVPEIDLDVVLPVVPAETASPVESVDPVESVVVEDDPAPVVVAPEADEFPPVETSPDVLGTGLTVREIEAVALSQAWRDKYVPPILGRNGTVVYHFGESIAVVVAAPGNVTDIIFEPGEIIVDNGIYIGDSVNWEINPIAQPMGGQLVSHLIIKPFHSYLETSMAVLTDRRTYYFFLHSTESKYMTAVRFNYPSATRDAMVAYRERVSLHEAAQTAQQLLTVPAEGGGSTQVPADALDFGYQLSGDQPRWLPVRVYSDERKTYIQLPRRVRYNEAPVFMALDDDDARRQVNYRLVGDTYIIDGRFDAGVLLAGVGGNQQVVRFDRVQSAGQGAPLSPLAPSVSPNGGGVPK